MISKLKKILIRVFVVFVIIMIIFIIGLQMKLKGFSDEIKKIEVNNIELSFIADGKYKGEYYMNEMAGATVEVTVQNHKIVKINILEHNTGLGKKAEVITENVIDQQSLEVDTISGATGSSIIILKAIDNALNEKNNEKRE
jgi:uncharacterized protein with FMN-binding domain